MVEHQKRQERSSPADRHKDTPGKDPKNPASKPNATTQDQVANMESEGQAQQPGQEPPAAIREELTRASRQSKRR